MDGAPTVSTGWEDGLDLQTTLLSVTTGQDAVYVLEMSGIVFA